MIESEKLEKAYFGFKVYLKNIRLHNHNKYFNEYTEKM